MVVMAMVLLNLFIAVLSTAHDEVYENAEKEYHLAGAKLIHQSAGVVKCRRPPPPLNLVKLVLGMLLDTMTEVPRLFLRIRGYVVSHLSLGSATSILGHFFCLAAFWSDRLVATDKASTRAALNHSLQRNQVRSGLEGLSWRGGDRRSEAATVFEKTGLASVR